MAYKNNYNDIKRNKTVIEINKDKKDKLEKKKLLLEKMKKVQVSENSPKSIKAISESVKVNKQLQKQKEQYESKIKNLELQILALKKQDDKNKEFSKNLNSQIKYLKNENMDFKFKLEEVEKLMTRKINIFNELILEKDNKVKLLSDKIELLSNTDFVTTMKELKNELKKELGNSKHHQNNYEVQREINRELKMDLSEFKKEFNSKVKLEKARLNSMGSQLRNEIDKIKEERNRLNTINKTTKHMLFALNRDLTEDNAFNYGHGLRMLNKNFERIIEEMRKKQEVKWEEQQRVVKKERRDWVIENSDIGYVGVDNEDNWYFYTIDNHIYSVTSSKVLELVSDIPARAIIDKDENSANVIYCFYDSINSEEIELVEKKLNKIKPKKQEDDGDFLYFGDFNVLIVGSREKQKYVWRGQKHGLTIIWHDPYEENESRLKDKLQQCDIAVICVRHVPHTVTDIIDKTDTKIQILEQDNEEKIMARIRFTAIRLGLIKFNPNFE